MIYRPTAAAVVYRINTHKVPVFLAVQKPNWDRDEWGVVQGGIERAQDSTLEATVKRELLQELGTTRFGHVVATGKTTQRVFSEKTLSRYNDQTYIGKETTYFGVEFQGRHNDITIGPELCAYRWFGAKNFLKRVKYASEITGIVAAIKKEYAIHVVSSPDVRRESHSDYKRANHGRDVLRML